ncbi:MAG TPA: hypothetical protein G4O15_02410 [Dehalococcoidia bacterium]|nr:hypothetical protein [Dehalococcoidia bacterium]
MERTEWLKQMRDKAEKLYDLYAPGIGQNLGDIRMRNTWSISRSFSG